MVSAPVMIKLFLAVGKIVAISNITMKFFQLMFHVVVLLHAGQRAKRLVAFGAQC